ncbi:MAG: hypothetical protein MK033_07235 [Candidatus Caenarcaniphilales bacterium]|nr:hypothetical protein [Candidatus Caenarcaniphilales bacterium]
MDERDALQREINEIVDHLRNVSENTRVTISSGNEERIVNGGATSTSLACTNEKYLREQIFKAQTGIQAI